MRERSFETLRRIMQAMIPTQERPEEGYAAERQMVAHRHWKYRGRYSKITLKLKVLSMVRVPSGTPRTSGRANTVT